ncbi:hypothetical protein CY35_11G053900 [Sphagnum magellanicum]|nr:hypothetical protein CY35_11G053900 [Sphagnum magellanicum]
MPDEPIDSVCHCQQQTYTQSKRLPCKLLARPHPPSAAAGPNEKHQSIRALVFGSRNNLKSPFVVLGPPLSFLANKVRLSVEKYHDPIVYNVNVNANPGARIHSVKYRF